MKNDIDFKALEKQLNRMRPAGEFNCNGDHYTVAEADAILAKIKPAHDAEEARWAYLKLGHRMGR